MQQNEMAEVIEELQSYDLIVKIDLGSYDEILGALTNVIDDLIQNNFAKLVQLLYRLDVNEEKVRTLINKESDKPAANLIAQLIMQRQLQKMQLRKSSNKTNNIPEDERW